MQAITHTTANALDYRIHFGDFLLGFAKKVEEGFIGETVFGDFFSEKTMTDLKQKFKEVAFALKGLQYRMNRKVIYMTVDEARISGGISHGGIMQRTKEFARYHHYLAPRHYGVAIMVIAMRAQARWPNLPGADSAIKWLTVNADRLPEVKELDTDHLDRTGQVRFLGE